MPGVTLDRTAMLIDGALRGDVDAVGALLERLRPRVVLWATSRMSRDLRSRVDPEDVTQDILLAVHQGIGTFTGTDPRAFLAWVFRIGENRIRDAADYHGAAKRQPAPPLSVSQVSPSMGVARAEEIERVRAAIDRLKDEHREVIRLRRLEERPTAEVAALMGRSETAVRILYCRALKALRAELPDAS